MAKLRNALLALFMAVMMCVPATALAADNYTYTVTLVPGNQGTLNENVGLGVPANAQVTYSPDKITISNLNYGDVVQFENSISNLGNKNKYYTRGIRVSGLDNSTVQSGHASYTVKADRDYVVAYGLKGKLVDYTVRFVDTEGNQLIEDRVYQGNAGDKPVVAYVYLDGYRPEAYNLTGTLSENPNDNVFTFVYTKLAGAGGGEGVDETIVIDEGTTITGATPAEETLIDENGNPLGEPVEIIDIDENANPLAGTDQESSRRSLFEQGSAAVIVPLIVSSVIFVVGASLLIAWFIVRRRRKKKERDAAGE